MKDIKENATITLVNRQSGGSESDKIEFTSGGNFYQRDGAFFVTYKEHSEMGMGDSRVLLKVEDDRVTMRRMGEFRSVMNYEPGKTTEFIYRVPFGEMNIKLKTRRIENNLSENGGWVEFSYILFVNGDEINNEVHLDIRVEDN